MGKIVRRLISEYQPVAEWSADDPDSYKAAQEVLRHEIDAGFTAVLHSDGHNEPITELPRDAEMVILTTAMGGG
jgi:hypothetical protein